MPLFNPLMKQLSKRPESPPESLSDDSDDSLSRAISSLSELGFVSRSEFKQLSDNLNKCVEFLMLHETVIRSLEQEVKNLSQEKDEMFDLDYLCYWHRVWTDALETTYERMYMFLNPIEAARKITSNWI